MKDERQTIWLCRHGNRIDFVDPSWPGENPHLSDDGVVQAKETGARLNGEGIQHIFASPFLRTVETAHYITQSLRLKIKIEYGASEWLHKDWSSGDPEHIPIADLIERFPDIDSCYTSAVMPRYPESSEQSLERAGKAACALADTHRADILIIGHAHSVIGMARGLMGGDCSVSPDLCALVKIVRQNGSVEIELDGDSSHLSGEEEHRDKIN